MAKTSTKKKVVTYAFDLVKGRRVYAKEAAVKMNAALGPPPKVVKMLPAPETDASKVLVLSCGHRRVATPRPTLRCRKCRTTK